MAKQKHWKQDDFVVCETSPAYDSTETVNRFGYCRVCKGDMQSFGKDGTQGPILHYNTHKYARQLGLAQGQQT